MNVYEALVREDGFPPAERKPLPPEDHYEEDTH
jgi:hypothetical protein